MSGDLVVSLRIGAALSSSFNSVFGNARNTLTRLGSTTTTLSAQQQRLGQIMSRAIQHPMRDIGALQRRYEQLGATIEELRRHNERLTLSLARGQQLNQQRRDLRGQFTETAATGLAIGAPIIGSVKLASDFQDKLRDISITGGFSNAQENNLGAVIRKSALDWNQTQSEIASGIGVLVSGGMSDVKSLEAYAPKFSKVATATRASMEDIGNVALSLKNNLGITAEGFDRSMNMLAFAGKEGQFELKDMAKWLPNLAPAFQTLGLQGEDAVAEIGAALQIARRGAGTNDEAANNFRNFLAKITSPDTLKDFAKANIDLKQSMLNLRAQGMTPMQSMFQVIQDYMQSKSPKAAGEFNKAMKIKDDKEREQALSRLKESYKLGELFQDMQAMNFIKPMITDMKDFNNIKNGSKGAAGKDVIGDDFKKRMGSFNEQFKTVKINFTEIGLTLGEVLLPPLVELSNDLLPVIKGFATWAKQHPELIKNSVGLFASLIIGKLAFISLRYGINLVLSPFNALGSAIAMARGEFALFRALGLGGLSAGRFAPLISNFRQIGVAIKFMGQMMSATPLGRAITLLTILGIVVYTNRERIIGWVTDLIGWFVKWYDKSVEIGTNIIEWFANLPNQFMQAGSNLVDGLINGIKNKLSAAKETIVGFGSNIKGWFAETLGIKSPSRVFMGFGDNIAQGAALGIHRSSDDAVDASKSMARRVADTAHSNNVLARLAVGGSGSSGGHTIHFSPIIHISAANGSGITDQVQQGLNLAQRDFERMLDRALASRQRRAF